MNVTGYSSESAQSAIAANFTAFLSQTRSLLFLRTPPASAIRRSSPSRLSVPHGAELTPAAPTRSTARQQERRTPACRVPSSPTCPTSSRARRYCAPLLRPADRRGSAKSLTKRLSCADAPVETWQSRAECRRIAGSEPPGRADLAGEESRDLAGSEPLSRLWARTRAADCHRRTSSPHS